MHYIGQYWDDKGFTFDGQTRKIRQWITLDYLMNYTFNMPAPAAAGDVAGLLERWRQDRHDQGRQGQERHAGLDRESNPCGWRAWLIRPR